MFVRKEDCGKWTITYPCIFFPYFTFFKCRFILDPISLMRLSQYHVAWEVTWNTLCPHHMSYTKQLDLHRQGHVAYWSIVSGLNIIHSTMLSEKWHEAHYVLTTWYTKQMDLHRQGDIAYWLQLWVTCILIIIVIDFHINHNCDWLTCADQHGFSRFFIMCSKLLFKVLVLIIHPTSGLLRMVRNV